MGTQINDIVIVNITRESAKLTRAGFGTLMCVGTATFPEITRTYSSIDEAQADSDAGLISANVFTMVSKAFSQEIKPESVKVGKRVANQAQSDRISVDVVADNTQYDVTINGTPFSFTSDADATAIEIGAGLVGEINGGSEPVTATDNLDGTFDLVSDNAGLAYTLSVGTGLSSTSVAENVNMATNLSAIEEADSQWYALNIEHATLNADFEADVLASAEWIEPRRKIFGFTSQDISITQSVSSDIMSQIMALGYDRTFGEYHDEANDQYPESAWFGRCLPEDAGSITWKFKQLSGVTAVALSGTQLTNLDNKNCNYYEEVAGVNIISSEAVVASGEYIDVIRGTDWLQANIEEGVFTVLLNSGKVPFTNDGITMVVGPLRASLQAGVDRDFLASFEVDQPDISAVPSADRADRCLNNIKFTGVLAGAIHKVKIDGTLSVA